MIKVNNGKIETEGNAIDLLSEASIALIETVRRVSQGKTNAATIFMFSTVNTAIEELAKQGIEIDMKLFMYFCEKTQNGNENE